MWARKLWCTLLQRGEHPHTTKSHACEHTTQPHVCEPVSNWDNLLVAGAVQVGKTGSSVGTWGGMWGEEAQSWRAKT